MEQVAQTAVHTLSAFFLSLKIIFDVLLSPSFLMCCCGSPAQRDYKIKKHRKNIQPDTSTSSTANMVKNKEFLTV